VKVARRVRRAGCGTHRGQPRQGATARPNWRHTRRGDKHVTVIIDLTPIAYWDNRARNVPLGDGM
jgi:hypothetical protein